MSKIKLIPKAQFGLDTYRITPKTSNQYQLPSVIDFQNKIQNAQSVAKSYRNIVSALTNGAINNNTNKDTETPEPTSTKVLDDEALKSFGQIYSNKFKMTRDQKANRYKNNQGQTLTAYDVAKWQQDYNTRTGSNIDVDGDLGETTRKLMQREGYLKLSSPPKDGTASKGRVPSKYGVYNSEEELKAGQKYLWEHGYVSPELIKKYGTVDKWINGKWGDDVNAAYQDYKSGKSYGKIYNLNGENVRVMGNAGDKFSYNGVNYRIPDSKVNTNIESPVKITNRMIYDAYDKASNGNSMNIYKPYNIPGTNVYVRYNGLFGGIQVSNDGGKTYKKSYLTAGNRFYNNDEYQF